MKRLAWVSILVIAALGATVYFLASLGKNRGTYSASLVGNAPAPLGFARADGSYTWNFPEDFGPHPEYQTEWWYYTGNLKATDGRQFGYQLTFFRRGLIPPQQVEPRLSAWGASQVYMGHFAISDIAAEAHYDFERFARGAAGLAAAQSAPFQVWLENWEVRGTGGDQYQMYAEGDGVSLKLSLEDIKGITFHGFDGYSKKGPESGNASYYFSQTRLASQGVLRVEGREFQVEGLSWIDHEFSTSALSAGQVGWDWFSLQLDEGTDVMLFQIRRADGSVDPVSSGTMITPDGEVLTLDRDQFELEVKASWRSPHSKAEYPASWRIHIPEIELVLDIDPYMADQEMNVSYVYWEGAVGVRGTYRGKDVTGSGYVEMTGYAASIEGEF